MSSTDDLYRRNFLIPPSSHSPLLQVAKGDGPIGLVVAPTRELAEQIHKEARKFSKPYGGYEHRMWNKGRAYSPSVGGVDSERAQERRPLLPGDSIASFHTCIPHNYSPCQVIVSWRLSGAYPSMNRCGMCQ